MSRVTAFIFSCFKDGKSSNVTEINTFDSLRMLHSLDYKPARITFKWETTDDNSLEVDDCLSLNPCRVNNYEKVLYLHLSYVKHGVTLHEVDFKFIDPPDYCCFDVSPVKASNVRYYIERDGVRSVHDEEGVELVEAFESHPLL